MGWKAFTDWVCVCVVWFQVLAQLQAQQGAGSLPQHIKLQLPIQIQQTGTTSAQGGQVRRQHLDAVTCSTELLGSLKKAFHSRP